MRSGFNKIVVLVIGLVIFVTGSTAIITLAQEPSTLPQENSGAITVDIAPAVFASHYYAENPELMAAQRVAVDNVPAQSASHYYAENPELLAAHRVEAGSPVDNALDTEPHHPRLRGMLVY